MICYKNKKSRCRCSTSAYFSRDNYEELLKFIDKGGTVAEWDKKAGELLTKNPKSDKIKLLEIGKSVGAAARNYPVKMIGSKQSIKLAEGQTIKGRVFAGKGTNIQIRDRYNLETKYKIPSFEWQKVSGDGFVIINGKKQKAELHWYEAKGKRYEIKIKRLL